MSFRTGSSQLQLPPKVSAPTSQGGPTPREGHSFGGLPVSANSKKPPKRRSRSCTLRFLEIRTTRDIGCSRPAGFGAQGVERFDLGSGGLVQTLTRDPQGYAKLI